MLTAMRSSRHWRRLPYDGQGLFPPPGAVLGDLRQVAGEAFWNRVPRWCRPLVIPVARLAWLIACAVNVWSYPRDRTLRLFFDCLRSGALPVEAWVWRNFFPPPQLHPLPGRAAAQLLGTLGDPKAHRLLSDKLATGQMLERAGLAVPPLLGLLRPGRSLAPDAPARTYPGELFVKPRCGSGGRGAMIIPNAASLPADVRVETLVQARLRGSLLRLTTARYPREAPFLHSAFVAFDVPREDRRKFIKGQIRVPIDTRTGLLSSGIWFLYPGTQYESLPWNGSPLKAHPLPDFRRAADMVLEAMALVPGLPLVNWDLMMTPSGPVILEGNTCGDWILTNLSTVAGIETPPLVPLLRCWAAPGRHAFPAGEI